jgi:hypothetical protein
MSKLHLLAILCFAAGAATAGTSGGGGHGGGGASVGGGSGGVHSGGTGSAARPSTGTHIGNSSGKGAAAVVAVNRATVAGREVLLAKVKLPAPLTDSDRDTLKRHRFVKHQMHGLREQEPEEVWCPEDSSRDVPPRCFAFERDAVRKPT